jgi:MarR family transcriptional regulator, transcriptional regulator for hemolysin
MDAADRLRFDLTSTMHRVGRQWRRLVRDVVTRHGISEASAHPLVVIGRLGGGIRQVALAEEVGIEGPSLVRLLDQLCACGLVERRDDPADRRAKTLWLTAEGRKATGSIESDLTELRRDILAGIGESDLHATLRVFQAFDHASQAAASAVAEPEDETE